MVWSKSSPLGLWPGCILRISDDGTFRSRCGERHLLRLKLRCQILLERFGHHLRSSFGHHALHLCNPAMLNHGDNRRAARSEALAYLSQARIWKARVPQLCCQPSDDGSGGGDEDERPGDQTGNGTNYTAHHGSFATFHIRRLLDMEFALLISPEDRSVLYTDQPLLGGLFEILQGSICTLLIIECSNNNLNGDVTHRFPPVCSLSANSHSQGASTHSVDQAHGCVHTADYPLFSFRAIVGIGHKGTHSQHFF